jgi:hypothetical protein
MPVKKRDNLYRNYRFVSFHKLSIEYVDRKTHLKKFAFQLVTYIKAYDVVRELFAKRKTSKIRGDQTFFFNTWMVDASSAEKEPSMSKWFMADVHHRKPVTENDSRKKTLTTKNDI